MQFDTNHSYFANHPVLRTNDLDEARARVAQTFCDHRLDLGQRQQALSVTLNAVQGKHISVNYLAYGADVAVNPGYLGDFYLFQLPLSGRALVRHRGEEMIAHTGAGTVLNPDRRAVLRWDATCRQIMFQIRRSHLEEVARSLTGVPLPGPVRFDTAVDFSTPGGRILYRSFMTCAAAIERGTLFHGPSSSMDTQVEFDLVQHLLLHQQSNISHILARSRQTPKPREIRRALDYMHANIAEQITILDIAQAAQVNVRTLQLGFWRTFGLTPMQVLRNARLDTAHYLLTARQDMLTVSDAAYTSGFSHLGRFSSYYRARFGHAPSRRT